MAPSATLGSAFGVGVLISGQKMAKKYFQKNSGKISKFFFSIFPKFFSIEIIPREHRLRTQNFMTVGQTVSAVDELTDRQTQSPIYYIDVFLDKIWIFAQVCATVHIIICFENSVNNSLDN